MCEGVITVQFGFGNVLVIHDNAPAETSDRAEENIQEKTARLKVRSEHSLLFLSAKKQSCGYSPSPRKRSAVCE